MNNSNAYPYHQSGAANDESAETIHVPVSQTTKHDKDRKLRKKYKRLKQDTSKQMIEYHNENTILRAQIEDLQRRLFTHEKKLRKSKKEKSHNHSRLTQQHLEEVSVLQE